MDMPPAMMNAPENAQVRLEYMSFGVISSKHCSGFAPKGMTKPSYTDVSLRKIPCMLVPTAKNIAAMIKQ